MSYWQKFVSTVDEALA